MGFERIADQSPELIKHIVRSVATCVEHLHALQCGALLYAVKHALSKCPTLCSTVHYVKCAMFTLVHCVTCVGHLRSLCNVCEHLCSQQCALFLCSVRRVARRHSPPLGGHTTIHCSPTLVQLALNSLPESLPALNFHKITSKPRKITSHNHQVSTNDVH